ncbi:hypothetical protein RhiirA1_445387 [Rhizophagus irregularis]|uniref:Uncharacterized protein n=1 Tax=Rhizophagus irregularis TaxID=588596 RepID=A0A2N0R870_9GLOM|nr:hypothetical protein RhiirA1_445387 [Rhizophagus irregularis]
MENFGDYHDLYLKTDVLLLVNVFINYTIMCLIIPQFKHIYGTGWSYIIDDLNYTQAKAFGLVLNEMDATKNWENHLINVFKSCYVHFKRKIYEKRYDDILANDMLALLTATSEVEINNLFNKIETKKPEVLHRNIAETTHALSNRHGKNLKIVTAILQTYCSQCLSNKRQANTKIKKSNNTKSIPIKRKQNVRASSSKKKAKKAISIISDNSEDEDKCHNDNDNNKENNASKSFSKFDELEYQERNLALKEWELDLREREAKVRIMELAS